MPAARQTTGGAGWFQSVCALLRLPDFSQAVTSIQAT